MDAISRSWKLCSASWTSWDQLSTFFKARSEFSTFSFTWSIDNNTWTMGLIVNNLGLFNLKISLGFSINYLTYGHYRPLPMNEIKRGNKTCSFNSEKSVEQLRGETRDIIFKFLVYFEMHIFHTRISILNFHFGILTWRNKSWPLFIHKV